MAGELGQPLGGPVGGGGQDHLGAFGAGQGDDGADGEALAAAGAAGQHGDLAGERQPDGLALLGGQLRAGLAVQPLLGLVPVDVAERLEPVVAAVQQRQQGAGQGQLGAVERRQVDGGHHVVAGGDLLADGALLGDEVLQAGDGQGVHLQDLDGVADQVGGGR